MGKSARLIIAGVMIFGRHIRGDRYWGAVVRIATRYSQPPLATLGAGDWNRRIRGLDAGNGSPQHRDDNRSRCGSDPTARDQSCSEVRAGRVDGGCTGTDSRSTAMVVAAPLLATRWLVGIRQCRGLDCGYARHLPRRLVFAKCLLSRLFSSRTTRLRLAEGSCFDSNLRRFESDGAERTDLPQLQVTELIESGQSLSQRRKIITSGGIRLGS